MAYTPARPIPGVALSNVATTYYTVIAPYNAVIIKEITVCNTGANAANFCFYVVPANGTANAGNAEFNSVTLQPNETKIFPRTSIGPVGYTIQANCSANANITLSVSGMYQS